MASSPGNALGLYISIPFCRSKCTYCNFASGVYPASEHQRYVDRLLADLPASRTWAKAKGVELPHRVDTVYLGGGTPSLLAPELIERLFAAVRAEFDLEPDAEITVECAPGQIADATLDALVRAGVNRVSLGVQSFLDREAAESGRLHNRVAVMDDLHRLRAVGISNLNVDLIAGLAGQTFASWEESLDVLAKCGVPHASVYMLEVDEDSRLGRELLAHGVRYHAGLVPTDDAIAQMYTRAIERLDEMGLAQYEISNFCRPGMESRHNLRYWQRQPYLGLGVDASSMLRQSSILEGRGLSRVENEVQQTDITLAAEGMQAAQNKFLSGAISSNNVAALRWTTTDDLRAYLAGTEPVETTRISVAEQHEEAWFLGLRLSAGIHVAALEREFGAAAVAPALQIVRRLTEDGLLDYDGQTVRLTAQGQLLSNDVFQEFLGLDAKTDQRR